ncbi:MAG: mechanosensitive ion channel domain-containing protein [Cyanobacteria bacterium P01_A01_bin.114]
MLPQSLLPWLARLRSFWLRAGLLCAVSLLISLLGLGIARQPGMAQPATSPPPKADVLIDGRVLFRLGSIDGFTAEGRADFANADLQRALQTTPLDRPIRVIVVHRDGLTTIRANNRHLLTVTGGDFMTGVTPREQADKWAEILRAALQQAQRERRPAYYREVIWRMLAALTMALALYGTIRWGRRRWWRRWARQPGVLSYRKRLVPPALLCLQAGVWLAFLIYVCELFPQARTVRYKVFRFLENTFNNALLTVDEQAYSLIDIFKLILLIIVLWVAVRGLTALVKSRFLQAAIPDRGVQDAIATLMQFGLTGLGLFILLQAWGIDLSALAILASVLGVGLGFGLQDIANNFISGWILLIERPVQVGDFINLDDLLGTVERIGARSTEIRTLDRVSIIVPNAELVQARVVNWSHGHPVSRLHLPLSVAYHSPIKKVHAVAIEAAQAHPEVLQYPRPRLRFLGFGESALDFDLLVWIREPRHQFDIKSDLYYLLEANLRQHQIEIPFPQRDLNLRTPHLKSMTTSWHEDIEPLETEPAIASPANLLATVSSYSAILQTSKSITAGEIDRLVEQIRGPNGLTIQDRRFRLTVYQNCFVGSEAVTWIVKTQKATREEAIRLGQLMVERGIFHHVIDEHPFKDEYLFYRFYEDEE